MIVETTLNYLTALEANLHPETGIALPATSPFAKDDAVRTSLSQLRLALAAHAAAKDRAVLSDEALLSICREILATGFDRLTPTQIIHICRGSKRVVNPELHALPFFGRYRHEFSRTELAECVKTFAKAHPSALKKTEPDTAEADAWKQETFFDQATFDQLDEEKFKALADEVAALGLRRSGEKLPDFIAKIRNRYARSFEPWTKAERALLLEAMCYTNRADRLAELLGRSTDAVVREGKQLIYNSRKQHAA
jgi:hypothetical protein